jgi:hypothetical protein
VEADPDGAVDGRRITLTARAAHIIQPAGRRAYPGGVLTELHGTAFREGWARPGLQASASPGNMSWPIGRDAKIVV